MLGTLMDRFVEGIWQYGEIAFFVFLLCLFLGLRQALECITTAYLSNLNVPPPAIYSGKQEHLSCSTNPQTKVTMEPKVI